MIPPAHSDPLDAIAARLADGEVIDWETLESSAPDAATRDAIRHLRAVASIARAHALYELDSRLSLTHATSGTSTTADDSTPTEWGALRIIGEIGRGRFGTVYRAWDPALDREVALKLLRTRDVAPASPPAAGDDEALVVHEGRLMARIRHPNVVTIHGAQRIDGRTGIWMELVEGQTLEAELKARGPFAPGEVAAVGIELCRALAAVHAAGLVHRDVKAQNVLREVTGRIALGDFGTGRELDDLERERGIAGTPAYLAPEIFERAAATPRSDLYSLGTLLFHLATGSYPVLGRNVGEIREAHALGRRDSLLALRPDFPPGLAAVIDQALDRDPSRRHSGASALEAALAGGVAETTGPSPYRHLWSLAAVIGASAALVMGTQIWRAGAASGGGGASESVPAVADRAGRVSQRQLSDRPALAGPGAPSPDGRLLSFVWEGDLAVHEFATGRDSRLTHSALPDRFTGEAMTSRFTADGRALFYVWYPASEDDGPRPLRAELRRIDLDGRNDHLVWRAPAGRELTLGHWAGGDETLAGLLTSGGEAAELVRIHTPSGDADRLPVPRVPLWVSLAPDGTSMAFDQDDRGTPGIHIARADGSTTAAIADGSRNHHPLWTPDGRHLLFLSDRTGDVGLWAQRFDGGAPIGSPIRIEPSLGVAYPMGLTRAGGYVYRRQIGGRDVHVAPLGEDGTLAGNPIRLSEVRGDATGTSDWSPDERQVAFFRRRNYSRSLVIRDLASGEEREFSEDLEGVARPRWEPGGQSVLFKGSYRKRGGLHRLDVRTGRIVTVTDPLVHYEVAPDGGIVFTRDNQFFQRDATGRERLLHVPGGFISGMALAARTGRLAYSVLVNDVRVLRVVDPANPASVRDVFTGPRSEGLEVFAWTPDEQSLLVYRTQIENADNGVWTIEVGSGAGRWSGIPAGALQEFRLSPSGRRLSYDDGSPYQEPWIIENVLSRLESR